MKKSILLCCGICLAGWAETGILTLEQALERARLHSPELKAARLQTQAAGQAVDAAGRWKNPSLNLKAEGIGGDLDGLESTETEIMISQTFERGGKRRFDRTVAEKSIGIALQAEAGKVMELLAAVRLAFIEVFAQQEIGRVRAEQEELGRAFVEVAKRKQAAGGGSELEVVQAELALAEILLSQTCCFGDLEAARVQLSSLIGIDMDAMPAVGGAYYELESLDEAVLSDAHPAMLQLNAQIEALQAQAALAKARDAADITLAAGYKYEAAEEINTFVASASVPLNFVRPGRAEQVSVLTQVDALYAEREELRRTLQQQLSMLAALYNGARIEAEMTRDQLTPQAEKAYELCRAGYDAGRFSWFELINAQHHLAEIRIRYIEALRDAHKARAEITRFLQEGFES